MEEKKLKRTAYKKMRDSEPQGVYATFAKNLDALITAKGVSHNTLAAALGLSSPSSISMYRNGNQFPSNPEQLIKLANALDTTVDALLGNSNDTYVLYDDLMMYAETLNISPVAVSNIMRMSTGCNRADNGLDALLSHKDIHSLMLAIQEVVDKTRYRRKQLKENPHSNVRTDDALKALVYGKVYLAVRAFENILDSLVDAEFKETPCIEQEETDA